MKFTKVFILPIAPWGQLLIPPSLRGSGRSDPVSRLRVEHKIQVLQSGYSALPQPGLNYSLIREWAATQGLSISLFWRSQQAEKAGFLSRVLLVRVLWSYKDHTNSLFRGSLSCHMHAKDGDRHRKVTTKDRERRAFYVIQLPESCQFHKNGHLS